MLTETEFTAAAERHLDMVYRIALNSLRHPADAEDAVQNTMLRLWRTDTDFAGEEHLRRWLARVAVNESRRIAAHPWRGLFEVFRALGGATRGFASGLHHL